VTTLTSFSGHSANFVQAGVTIDASGNVYGTISTGGGPNDDGLVWEIKAGSSTVTTLASFSTDGPAGVTVDAKGDLFGTTFEGGSTGQGTVWELKAGSSTITTLASFNGMNGAGPEAGVTLDATGDIYGTTKEGSQNATVWEIKAGSSTITT